MIKWLKMEGVNFQRLALELLVVFIVVTMGFLLNNWRIKTF
jgi:hypothetical protein